MGTVYLGEHVDTAQQAAIKVLPAAMAREPGFVARFNREVAAMNKLHSPHIVELLDSGESDGTFYYAMEYVPGETLTARLTREKRIPWREVIEIGVQICRALKAAHNSGIIHRDIKPSNLMLREDGVVKLTDFGIAQMFASSKLTVTGGILGTAEYMSPEQAQGKRATKQSDIYSLGAVLYVMLTGRPPFTGKTNLEIAQKHRFSQFDSPKRIVPEIPFWLDEIVCTCLAKKSEDRYPDAYVLSLRLQEVPKKVDLRSSEQSHLGSGSPTAVTQADGSVQQPENEVSGTLVRELFRAQIESEHQSRSPIEKLFDNAWFLVGLLAAVIVIGIALAQWNRTSPETLFEKGVALMSRPEGIAWEVARRDHFQPLLALDEARWRSEVEPYLERIHIYELKKELLGKDAASDLLPSSEPEAILRQAMQLKRLGEIATAREKLSALATLLDDGRDQQRLKQLTLQMLDDLPADEEAVRLEFVRQSLARADGLHNAGELEEAVKIWRSVITLYDADPAAAGLVATARERLTASRSEALPE